MNDLTENDRKKNVSSNQSVVGCQSDQSMSFEAYSSPIGVRRQFTGRDDNSVKKYTFSPIFSQLFKITVKCEISPEKWKFFYPTKLASHF